MELIEVSYIVIYNYMNKRNTSEIKIRKKNNFRPIMLTSKSMKPVERSTADKYKYQDKIGTADQQGTRRRQSQNYGIYTNSIARAQIIKKLTQQYREQLIKNVYYEQKVRHKPKIKPMTPAIIHVQFDSEEVLQPKESRYQNLINGLSSKQSNSQNPQKYFYCTSSKTYDSFLGFNRSKLNTSIRFNNLSRSHSSKQSDDWNKFLDRYYLNVKKLHPQRNPAIEQKLSQQKMKQISDKVQQYQNVLLKKMQQRYKMNSSCQPSHIEPGQQSPTHTNFLKRNSNYDLEKIQQDMTLKRPSAKKQHFVFGLTETNKVNAEQLNKQKFQNYKDFLWKINFSNSIYVKIKDQIQPLYKLYVGPGNNCMLIKGIMRRRFWWQIIQKPNQQANFVWTQIKINQYFKYQTCNTRKRIQFSNRTNILLRSKKINSNFQQLNSNMQINSQQIAYNFTQRREPKQQKQQNQQSSINPITLQDPNIKIFKGKDYQIWQYHLKVNKKFQQKQQIPFGKRIKSMVRRKNLIFIEDSKKLKVQNHFQANYYLGNKKALFYSMRKYYTLLKRDPFQVLPLTFHISKGIEDPQYQKFIQRYQQFLQKKRNRQLQNIWIVKPGQMTNRGRGITVCSTLDEIKNRLKSKQKAKNGQLHTYIVQKYIQKPLLYNKRKFDIRHYMLMTCVNGKFKGYWYEQGYLRTTSNQYNIKNCKDLYTHLTNDAIQKYSPDYGKFQKGNKVSYADFQKYLNLNYRYKNGKSSQVDKYDFFGYILPKMKDIAADSMRATYLLLSPKRYNHNFQLFGLDFMLDEDMNVYLIQVNTNPCLQTSCPLLSRLISSVVQNLFKVCVDPLFPPPYDWPNQRKMPMGDNTLQQNRFSIIFDQNQESQELTKLFQNSCEDDNNIGQIDQQDQFYEDQGKQWVED